MQTLETAQAALDALATGPDGRLTLHAENLTTRQVLSVDGERQSATASCIKLFILAQIARRMDNGTLDPDQEIEMRVCDQVGGSGVLRHLSAPLRFKLRDVAMLMMIQSDNTATNMALDLVGLKAVNTLAAELGCAETTLRNRIDFDAIGTDIRNLAVGSARDFCKLLSAIATGDGFSRKASRFMLDILTRQNYLDLLPRKLGFNPYAADLGGAQELWIGHKTGFFPGFRGDVGIWKRGGQTVVVAAFVEDADNPSFAPDNPAALKLGRVGEIVAGALLP